MNFDNEMSEMQAWFDSRFMRTLDWIEAHTTGAGTWPWGMIWMKKRFAFHFASGHGGFYVSLPIPRWLPGFVRPYQVEEIKTRKGRKNTDLTLLIPIAPLGWWHTSRTRRLKRR